MSDLLACGAHPDTPPYPRGSECPACAAERGASSITRPYTLHLTSAQVVQLRRIAAKDETFITSWERAVLRSVAEQVAS